MLLKEKIYKNWTITFGASVIILAGIALAAEVLPELESKIIVIPTLILTILFAGIKIFDAKHLSFRA